MTAVDLPSEPSRAGPPAAPPLLDTPEARDALSCPLCGYSLRGLAAADRPQCPECGYRFDWAELLRARQHAHPYLFEHHPRRGIRSLFRTFFAGLFPERFWSSLNAAHEIDPRRLFRYWVLTAVAVVLTGSAGTFIARGFTLYYQNRFFFPGGRRPQPWDPAFLRTVFDTAFEQDVLEIYLMLAALAWPWLTMATLLVFRASMRRVHVRPAHVLRCVVYGGDVFVWLGPALAAMVLLRWLGILGSSRMWDNRLSARQTAACFLLVLAVAGYRLAVAYRRYLRFDHPWATALASQVVVFLFITTALSLFYSRFWVLLPTD